MEIRQLRYFMAVVDEGNISNAAKALNMSQPPLSIQIRSLEEELGCTLFERDTRHIRLTEAGRILYDRAAAVLDLLSSTENELNDFKAGLRGTIRIGVVSSVISNAFTDWIVGFHTRYQDVKFALYEANTYDLIEKVRSGQIELAFVRTPFNAPDLNCHKLQNEAIVALGREKFFEDVPSEQITVEELAGKPLIIYRRWEGILRNAFSAHDVSPNIICVNDDARTTVNFANAGLGVGVAPASVISSFSGGRAVKKPICDLMQSSGIAMVCRKNAYISAAAKLFMDYVARSSVRSGA